jgi:hypothetical protein
MEQKMANRQHTKNKNQQARQAGGVFTSQDLRAAIGSSPGRLDQVAAKLFAAVNAGRQLSVEAITWLQQNVKLLLKEAKENMIEWLQGFAPEPTPAKGVWNV